MPTSVCWPLSSCARARLSFTAPVKTMDGNDGSIDNRYYRVFDWVKGSHTIDVVETPEQAFEAANQFGLFTSILKNLTRGYISAYPTFIIWLTLSSV